VVSDNKVNKLSLGKSPQIPSPCKRKSTENFVFGSWGLEVETKGLESISEFFPSLSSIKNLVSLTLIPLPMIEIPLARS
jgi:hypothetical protein